MIYGNVLEAVGHTPMIRLKRMAENESAEILVKYEGLNVGGSIKTRTALNMIEDGERRGLIGPDTVIVEPTSGNQGIGLALIGAVRGYRVKIIMPDSVSVERRKLIAHYGAEVILVHDAGNIGDAIEECRLTALKMAEEDPNVFIPGQFENPANPMVHKHHTALEILEQVAGPIHGFCSGVGTGGTISGIGESLKALNPDITVWAVEPEHAAILAGGNIGTHLQMGIGDGLIPDNLNRSIGKCLFGRQDRFPLQVAVHHDNGRFIIGEITDDTGNLRQLCQGCRKLAPVTCHHFIAAVRFRADKSRN